MKWKPYPRYKDSGVEWLGKVPAEWEISALKHIVSTPITDGPHETPTFVDDGIPFVSAEAVASGNIDFSKIRGFITEADHLLYSKKYRPNVGDVYLVKSGATTGVTAIVDTDIDFNIWSPLAAIRCGTEALPRFVLNFMRSRSFQEAVTLNWSFGTQQNIGMGVIENLAITLPPTDEQQAIVIFIDRETTKLDTLIAKQERLIELLQEKRQALISHAVTKGLNPDAPMKDSGVEWLGQVPAHWTSPRLSYVTTIIVDGAHLTPSYVDEGIPFLRVTDIQHDPIDLAEVRRIPLEEHRELTRRCKAQRGDLLLSKNGTIGVPRVVDWDWPFSYFVDMV